MAALLPYIISYICTAVKRGGVCGGRQVVHLMELSGSQLKVFRRVSNPHVAKNGDESAAGSRGA
jgi:hypothetical protein